MVLPTPEDKNNVPNVSRYGTTFPVVMTMGAFMTIALYNVIELHFLLFSTFKRKWQGLYFWSVFACIWGIAMNGLAVVFEFFQFAETHQQLAPIIVFLILGWYLMVTGQSLVLYSRLHLLAVDSRIIRGVLIMIIVDAIVLHIPNTIAIFLVNLLPSPSAAIQKWYLTYEPITLTVFSVQELIISGLYIFRTLKVLKASQGFRGTPAHRTLLSLIYINVFIIAMDITLVALQFAGYDRLQHFYKPAVYSVKLKLEFAVLNKLVEAMRGGSSTNPAYHGPNAHSSSHNTNTNSKLPHWITAKSTARSFLDRDRADSGYHAFAASKLDSNSIHKEPGAIPLHPVGACPVRKTMEVAVDYETAAAARAESPSPAKPSSASQASSQVQFARAGSE